MILHSKNSFSPLQMPSWKCPLMFRPVEGGRSHSCASLTSSVGNGHRCLLFKSKFDDLFVEICFSKFCFSFKSFSTDNCVLLFSGIRSVSFYEQIVTVGTGLGSLLFYDIRAQRFLEKPLNLTGCYRKCPGEGILKLTTGKGWVVRSPVRLYSNARFLPASPNFCFGFRITMRHGGATSRTSILSPTRFTRTVTTTLAPSCSWPAGRSVPACMATTQGCGASPLFFLHLSPSSPSTSSSGPGDTTVFLDSSSSFYRHCSA